MIQPDGTNAALAAGQALELDPPPDFVRHRGGRSPRQQRLDKLWSWYKTEQYAARKVAWDGSNHVGEFERDTIAIAGYVPPGFYVAGRETLPIAFRRPTTPYHISRVIVDRFTSLVFSQRRHPRVTVEGDADTDALINAVIEEGRLWPMMMQARGFGGATGTAVVGFKLVSGRPYFEVFDPRWCTPRWIDRASLVLESVEYRYPFMQEMRIDGEWQEVELWYRRVIDTQSDVIYHPEMLDPDEPREPAWREQTRVNHGFGFCPITWIHNLPVAATDLDGDPDCLGTFDTIEAMDRMIAQIDRALLANLDPTLAISTDAQMGEVRKGSDNALKLQKGDSVQYLEINAGGITAAEKKVDAYRDQILEVAQCVLEHGDGGGQKTATEVERIYAAMLAKADILREQYGETGVKRLLNMVIVVIAMIQKPQRSGDSIVRGTLSLPKRTVTKPDGTETVADHKLGPGPYRIAMHWPSYFEPSPEDTGKAVNSAVTAKAGGLIDTETGVRYVANFFGVEDVKAMVAKILREKNDEQADLERSALMGPRAAAKQLAGVDNASDDEREK